MESTSEPGPVRFPVTVDVPVAWGDMDAFGHVNNTVFLRWFETARIAYFERTGVIERMKREGVGPILARATVDFRLPVRYPDTIRASARVASFGRTSFVMRYLAESLAQGGAVAAEGEGVIVLLDYAKGGKVALDEATRRAIEALEATAENVPPA